MVVSWRRRLDIIWRNKILGFICGALFGLAFAVYASDVVSPDFFSILWKAFVGAVTVAVWFIRSTIVRITQKMEYHDTEIAKLSGVPERMKRIDDDLRRLHEDYAEVRQLSGVLRELKDDIKTVIDDWRKFQITSITWRAKVNERLKIESDE